MQPKIERLDTAGLVNRLGWSAFVDRWSTDVLNRLRVSKRRLNQSERDVLRAGTTRFPGAEISDVAALESRLKVTLSPSYRGFLAASNGLRSGTALQDRLVPTFWPASEVRWLHEQDPQLVKIWSQHTYSVTDAEYKTYGEKQDPVHARPEYLRRIIAISPIVESGGYLLNPNIRFRSGELEAWDFSVKYPGAFRYQSFAELAEKAYQHEIWLLDYWERNA